jgi:DNA polymerase
MATSRDLAEHLRYYAELGVAGFSRDPAWRSAGRVLRSGPADQNAGPVPRSGPADQNVGRVPRSGPAGGDDITGLDPDASGAERAGMTPSSRGAAALALVRADLGDCTRCRLHEGRRNLVFGVGSPEADLMFVGEGPGADEDEQGIPFVGRAGQLLTQIIKAMGYERDAVYIANVVKCRPPGNRNPEPDEIEQCDPFLMRQIEAVSPRVIVALGKFASQSLLRTTEPISRLRGRFQRLGDTPVMPTFHPSYLLRNPSAKREVWEDMKQVMALLQEAR